MTEIINRQRRVIVQPVRPRIVTLDRGQVARIAQRRPHTVVQPKPTNAVVRPESPVINVSNVGRPGQNGLPGGGTIPPIDFSFGDAASVVFNAPQAGTFTITRIEITTPFNATAAIRVGTSGQPEALMPAAKNNPSEAGSYEAASDFFAATGTSIRLDITPGGSTQGAGTLYLLFTPES